MAAQHVCAGASLTALAARKETAAGGIPVVYRVSVQEAETMSDPLLAEIRTFAGNFAPRGWLFCHGQILSIAQNTAVFSLLGTTYGGNGTVNFALPDLRGRVVVGAGNGPGLPSVQLGEMGGNIQVLTGTAQPHAPSQPFLALNFIIAIQGIYPSRN
jgi:microcystin-dependent protein